MELLIALAILIGVNVAVVLAGADSRDGRDWHKRCWPNSSGGLG